MGLSALLNHATYAAEESEDIVPLLFVQTADSVTVKGGTMTLEGVGNSTVYFSDRPRRIAGHIKTEEFVADWAKGDDSFAENPPNAYLSIIDGDSTEEIVMILKNPQLDGVNLTYDIVETLESEAPTMKGPGSLFIDTVGRPLTPVSVAGVARRTARRRD